MCISNTSCVHQTQAFENGSSVSALLYLLLLLQLAAADHWRVAHALLEN
jgi:hypothetical protein